MILAGDVGGTKCTFTLFSCSDSSLRPEFRLSLATRGADKFQALLTEFMAEAERQSHSVSALGAAAFGVAGAVVGDRVLSNNLPWPVEKKAVAETLHLPMPQVLLLNDLV